MKKRSNPAPLIAALILCFVVVGYLNVKNMPTPNDTGKPTTPDANPPAVGTSREAPDKASLKKLINTGSSAPTPAPMVPDKAGVKHLPGMLKNVPPGMLQQMNQKPPKPKPNESAISTQWYTDEANKSSGN